MSASQDFRDGVATGVSEMAKRLRTISSYGIEPSLDVIDNAAVQLMYEYGGLVVDTNGDPDCRARRDHPLMSSCHCGYRSPARDHANGSTDDA